VVCLLTAAVLVCGHGGVAESGGESPNLVKISADDCAAVVEMVPGERMLVREGDSLREYTVASISEGRMALERFGEQGAEKVIITLNPEGDQSVVSITQTGPSGTASGLATVGGDLER